MVRPDQQFGDLVVDERAVGGEQFAAVAFAQQVDQLLVDVGGVGLVARDDLELTAPQARGDLQRGRNR